MGGMRSNHYATSLIETRMFSLKRNLEKEVRTTISKCHLHKKDHRLILTRNLGTINSNTLLPIEPTIIIFFELTIKLMGPINRYVFMPDHAAEAELEECLEHLQIQLYQTIERRLEHSCHQEPMDQLQVSNVKFNSAYVQ